MAEGENGGAFLRPNAAEQAKLRGKVEERARAKKAKSKTEAAERKRQRDADKERIANIEQELAAKRAKREDEAEKTQTPFQKAATAARQSSREDAQRDEVCNALPRRRRDARPQLVCRQGLDQDPLRRRRARLQPGAQNVGHDECYEVPRSSLMSSHRWDTAVAFPQEWHERASSRSRAERTEALHRKAEATNT